jgi:signal transduction histidine kinase
LSTACSGLTSTATAAQAPQGLALGLWLSVATLAAALAYISHRLGQAHARQQQHARLLLAARVDADIAARTQAHLASAAQAEQALREALAAAEHTLGEVLQAAALPVLLTTTDDTTRPERWTVSQLNPAASALWPDARTGQSLDALLQQLQARHEGQPDSTAKGGEGAGQHGSQAATVGSTLKAALPRLAPGASLSCGGWRLARLALPGPGPATALLAASGAGWAASAGVQTQAAASASPATLGCSPENSSANSTSAPAADALAAASPPSAHHQDEALNGESDFFSFTLSHDLRAPIRVVEGFTRIVKEDYGRLLDRVGNDHLDRVLGAAARMNLMIDALLTLARLSSQPLARQPVNLSQLAHYVIDDLMRHHPERPAQVDIEPGLTAVGDPTLLRLVLENLLGNAWKYSARSACTSIQLCRELVDGRPVFVVRDQGAGFDMRSADRLFGLFQRLHSANDFPGTGVGLASVRRIVRRHGGDIWADAEPGRGANFHFTLAD